MGGAATGRAILQMGDAVAVGRALDQTHRPRPQWAMLALTGALMLIGVLANTYFAGLCTGYSSYSFHAQVWAVIPAMGVLIGCYFLDFSALGRHPLLGYVWGEPEEGAAAGAGAHLWGTDVGGPPHRAKSCLLQRVGTVLNPYADPYGTGYVNILLRGLLADAAFVGQGASPLPGEILHFASDFGLTFLTHRFGWIALVGIAAAFLLFSAVSLRKAAGEGSVLGSLVALAIALTFLLQVLTYLAESLGYGLFSSLSLPFVSAGRTALFVNAALVGFMLSVFRTGHVHRDRVVLRQSRPSIVSYADGKLVIDLRGDRA